MMDTHPEGSQPVTPQNDFAPNNMHTDNGNLPQPIFLLSLPRSGSTLLQRMLASHPDIATASEPHILLYPLLSMINNGLYALPNHRFSLTAINEFADLFPNGISDYWTELGMFARRLYAKSISAPVPYFLDKTPSYCFVASDILKLFDNAKYIFLWRHPLSVPASMLNRWGPNNPYRWRLNSSPHLFDGLAGLIQAFETNHDKVIGVRYEDLVTSPQTVLQDILDYLQLPNQHDLAANFRSVQLPGVAGDPNARLAEYQKLRKDRVYAWQKTLGNPLRKRWSRNYVNWIGQERLAIMGYDLDQILDEIESAPATRRYLVNDAYWMPYGFIYRLLNGPILRQNLRKWRTGQQFWAYR